MTTTNRILTTPGAVELRTVGSNLWRGECHKHQHGDETYETWETRVPGGKEKYTIWQSGEDFHIAIDCCNTLEAKFYSNPTAAMIAVDSLDHAHWLGVLRNARKRDFWK